MDYLNRVKGTMVGIAACDALGVTAQFLKPGTFPRVKDMIGGGSFCLIAGNWTDDTALTLCLAKSLIECKGFNPQDQLSRYIRWWQQGYMSPTKRCYDIGGTTSEALTRFVKHGYCETQVAKANSAGNGSLVRVAPIALYFANDAETALKMAALSSTTTHLSKLSIDACRLMAALMLGVLKGKSKEEILSDKYTPVSHYWEKLPLQPAIEAIRVGSYKNKDVAQVRGNGYVVNCLEAALWAFYSSESFEEGALKAVNLGEDAISTAVVFAELAGPYYGLDAIPPHWRERVVQIDLLLETAEQLAHASHSSHSHS